MPPDLQALSRGGRPPGPELTAYRPGRCRLGAGFKHQSYRMAAGIGKSTVLRDVRLVSDQLKGRLRRSGIAIPVLGLDGTGIKIRGQESSIVVAVDLDSRQPVAIARISELDLEGLIAWLKPLLRLS